MPATYIYMVALLAWTPAGVGTPDSGRFAHVTMSDCHARSQAFTKLHGTPLQGCKRITLRSWHIIAAAEVEFDFAEDKSIASEFEGGTVVAIDPTNKRLLAALKAIGKLHRGKTRDSQRVRKIIKEATQ